MKLTSPAFSHGTPLPDRFAREHGNVSPPLTFEAIPAGTASLVLIMDDPDAPGGTFTHWLVFNLPPSVGTIGENQLPPEASVGRNDFGDAGYGGPRPPSGTHRYFFHAYALDCRLALPSGTSRRALEDAMEKHVLENATWMGVFSAAEVGAIR